MRNYFIFASNFRIGKGRGLHTVIDIVSLIGYSYILAVLTIVLLSN